MVKKEMVVVVDGAPCAAEVQQNLRRQSGLKS
jgi:hypothetical protein